MPFPRSPQSSSRDPLGDGDLLPGFASGVKGDISHTASAAELRRALLDVSAGEYAFPRQTTGKLLDLVFSAVKSVEPPQSEVVDEALVPDLIRCRFRIDEQWPPSAPIRQARAPTVVRYYPDNRCPSARDPNDQRCQGFETSFGWRHPV